MKHGIKIPTVGESITEVTIAQWLKKDGEQVSADDLICEIESDKASFEIPAEHDGILKILAKAGETVAVGTEIARIEENGSPDGASGDSAAGSAGSAAAEEAKVPAKEGAKEGAKAPVKAAADEAAPAAKAAEGAAPDSPASSRKAGATHEVKIPAVGESITEVTLAKWLKKDGETVQTGDLLCEIESDKASFEIPSEHSGVLKTRVKEGQTVPVGAVIADISGDGETATEAPVEAAAKAPAKAGAKADEKAEDDSGAADGKSKISPVAANILREAGISAGQLQGSGPGGKITKEDALSAVKGGKVTAAAQQPAAPATPDQAAAATQPAGEAVERRERRERLSTLRKTISRRLVAVKNETAMLTTFNEVDMTAVKALRARYKDAFKEKYEIGLGFMSFFTRAVCIALKEWPAVNARLEEDQIVYHNYCDISIAVSTPRGLVVPVIRNAETLTLAGIEKAVAALAEKARDGKLSIEEMTGGTFTITNGGVFGSLMSTPIINAPQSAILGMHKIEDRPVALDGQVVIRPMMYVALSYDHRIIDGRESVSFLVRVKELLEDPTRMLLEI